MNDKCNEPVRLFRPLHSLVFLLTRSSRSFAGRHRLKRDSVCFARMSFPAHSKRRAQGIDNKHAYHHTKRSADSPYFCRTTMPIELADGIRFLHSTPLRTPYSPISEVENVLRNSFSFFFPSILFFVSIMARKLSKSYNSLLLLSPTLYSTSFNSNRNTIIKVAFPGYGVTPANKSIDATDGIENSSKYTA